MEVGFTSSALKQWLKLPAKVRSQIDARLTAFAETGRGDVKKLVNRAGARLRSGDYRVIFTIDGDTLTVHAVGHRRDIYE
jgi:mRNA interferase RelE/StbE